MRAKLYDYWRSGASYRVRIALHLKGVKADLIPVHLVRNGGEQHSDAYKALNPQELVPTFQDNAGTISQSMAILEYLEETYPDPALLPSDPRERAAVRALSHVILTDTHPLQNLRVLQRLKAMGHDQKAISDWANHWIRLGFQVIENHIEKHFPDGPYLFGGQLTLADVILVPQSVNAKRFGTDLKDLPRTTALIDRLLDLPAFRETHPDTHPNADT